MFHLSAFTGVHSIPSQSFLRDAAVKNRSESVGSGEKSYTEYEEQVNRPGLGQSLERNEQVRVVEVRKAAKGVILVGEVGFPAEDAP